MRQTAWTQRLYGPSRARKYLATGRYADGAYVVYDGYALRDKLKAAGFVYCSTDWTWRRAMTWPAYEAFDDACIGMVQEPSRFGTGKDTVRQAADSAVENLTLFATTAEHSRHHGKIRGGINHARE